VHLSLLVQGVLVPCSTLLLSAVFVWGVLLFSERVHLFLLSAWFCRCCVPHLCLSYGNMCTFPCWCRVFWCLVLHNFSKRVHPFLLSAWFCRCCVPHFCLSAVSVWWFVVMEICAPFPAGAGCSGALFHTSAVGSVCVGGL